MGMMLDENKLKKQLRYLIYFHQKSMENNKTGRYKCRNKKKKI